MAQRVSAPAEAWTHLLDIAASTNSLSPQEILSLKNKTYEITQPTKAVSNYSSPLPRRNPAEARDSWRHVVTTLPSRPSQSNQQWQRRFIVGVQTANARRALSLHAPVPPQLIKRQGPSLDSSRSRKIARYDNATVHRDTDAGAGEFIEDDEVGEELDVSPMRSNYETREKARAIKFIQDYVLFLAKQLAKFKFPVPKLKGQLICVQGVWRYAASLVRVSDQALLFARTLAVLDVLDEAIHMNWLVTLRYIWYLLKYLFDGPEQVARIIASLCALSGLLREHLNVGTRTSGRIAGNGLRLVLIDGSVVDSRPEFDLIPDAGRISRLLVDDALRYCLFIEKHSIATLLKQAGFSSLNNWSGMIVAGTGIPDYPTRSLLRRIDLTCPRMILVALVDGGPGGLISMLTLRHGAKGTLHESFGVPRIQWAGILPTQVKYLTSIGVPTVEFTSYDNKMLAGLEARTDIPPVWQRQLVQMGELRRKIDLDNVPLDILKRWTRRCLTHGTDNPYALGEQALGL